MGLKGFLPGVIIPRNSLGTNFPVFIFLPGKEGLKEGLLLIGGFPGSWFPKKNRAFQHFSQIGGNSFGQFQGRKFPFKETILGIGFTGFQGSFQLKGFQGSSLHYPARHCIFRRFMNPRIISGTDIPSIEHIRFTIEWSKNPNIFDYALLRGGVLIGN